MYGAFFCFSSRRRHTRSLCDWSSDVCSSDLNPAASIVAKQINYDPTRSAAGDLTAAVSTQSNSYGLEWGLQLTPGNFNSTSALTGDASTFEGGIANWVFKTNCAVVQTAAQSHGGTKSLQLTSSA